MDAGMVVEFVLLAAAPTVLLASALHAPRLVGWLRRHARRHPAPAEVLGPSIEVLAADLRRLLARRDSLVRTSTLPMRGQRIQAIEGAITDCAAETARALGVPHPPYPPGGRLPAPQLGRLLAQLSDAGLCLPAAHVLLGRSR